MIISNNYDYYKIKYYKIFCLGILRRWQEMYRSDATYHVLACALQHPAVDRVDLAVKYCGLQLGKDVAVAKDY